MNPTLIASLRTLITDPDRPDRDALVAVLDDTQATRVLACLAPPGSLAQIAAALDIGWSWNCDGWERQTDKLVGLITDPRCLHPGHLIETWSRIPNAVGVLRDRDDTLIAWAQQCLPPGGYSYLAILLGPSDESARLLVRSPFPLNIGITLWRWSMATDSTNPTAWQAIIDADMRAALHQRADSSSAFPAWGWGDLVDFGTVLSQIVDDLTDGWSPDHPSLRRRIAWLEHHGSSNLDIGRLALVASSGRSDALAEAVCADLGHDPSSIPRIAETVPWSRLHSRIQTVIDETMRRAPDRWERTWACALGQAPVERDTTIYSHMLLWRIAPERWNDLDPSIRAALVSRISDLPHHCYGWGVHPDLVGRWSVRNGRVFRFWNPDVPPDDLRAWAYADLLREQTSRQDAQEMIALLDTLPPDRRTRFEAIIDGRLGGRSEPSVQPPWEWAGWAALSAADRQTALETWLSVLWGDCDTLPAVRFWRARNDGLDTLALMVGEMLGLDDPNPLLAALIAQGTALRGNETDVGSSLPFPNDLDADRRAQIERLPIDRDAQAYAAWGLRVLARRADVAADLIALHPTVVVALAAILSPDQQEAITESSAAPVWYAITVLNRSASCAPAQEPTTLPRQRRIR